MLCLFWTLTNNDQDIGKMEKELLRLCSVGKKQRLELQEAAKNHYWVIYSCKLSPTTVISYQKYHFVTILYLCLEQKGAGYHLDLFWVAVLLAVCSFMGLPWYVAATVISIAHIDSLKMETETSAPGEQPKFLGVRYVVKVI